MAEKQINEIDFEDPLDNEDNLSEGIDFEEVEDSPLKELCGGQTFTSF
jgi:hypothetical protein